MRLFEGMFPFPAARGTCTMAHTMSSWTPYPLLILFPLPFADDQITEEGDGTGPERCVRGVGLS